MSYLSINNDIFVSIASFRDSECILTLKELYTNAQNPQNVYCGVYTQIDNNNNHEQCYDSNFPFNTNVKRLIINYKEAKGALWARIQIFKNLYAGEKYILMIDAHSHFVKHWDSKLIQYLEKLKSKGVPKPILAGYPAEHKHLDKPWTYFNCEVKAGKKFPEQILATAKSNGKYYKAYFISAGFLFTFGDFLNDTNIVEITKDLQYVWSGEELLFSIIAFVNNWDVYSSPYTVISHNYKSNDTKKEDKTDWSLQITKDKVSDKNSKMLLDELLTTNKLDKIRKVDDFYNLIGFDRTKSPNDDIKLKFTDESKKKLCELNESIDFQ